jgi:hypothetical protein
MRLGTSSGAFIEIDNLAPIQADVDVADGAAFRALKMR